ncbi:PPC domain-containing DNA-binding protein [Caldisphaera sp.]|uniref:PPC domain-containing DNA-binding protein n=1 Tax=Caldisphaera sp. TaxID=2060322 RepID=UPI0025C4A250|nr:PPC domain-containing DNA-binding protein [Caldisphaera sp.]
MKHRIDRNFIIAKLDKDEDLMFQLENLAVLYNINAGIILTGIGMLKNFEVGYFNGSNYDSININERYELVSMHGSITKNEPRLHIHVGLASPKKELIGGHLIRATVDPLVELTILKIDGSFSRVYNPETNLKEFNPVI